MNTVPTVHVYAPKAGNFFFMPAEWETMRTMTQDQLIEKVREEFAEDIGEDQVVYVVNHIQIQLMVK